MMVALGIRAAVKSLLGRAPVVVWLLTLFAVGAVSALERRTGAVLAADRSLMGVASGLAIPLLAYAAVARASGGGTWSREVASLASFGGDRRSWLLGVLLGSGTLLAVASGAIGATALLISGGVPTVSLADDLPRTVMITALGGTGYGALFACGATFGRRGWMRPLLFVLDWLLGGLGTAIAFPFPRGHILALLGDRGVIGMTQGATWLALWGLVLAYMVVAVFRTPR